MAGKGINKGSDDPDAMSYAPGSTRYKTDPEYSGNVPNASMKGDADDYRTGQMTPGKSPGNGLSGETQIPQFTGTKGNFSTGSEGAVGGPSEKAYANKNKGTNVHNTGKPGSNQVPGKSRG